MQSHPCRTPRRSGRHPKLTFDLGGELAVWAVCESACRATCLTFHSCKRWINQLKLMEEIFDMADGSSLSDGELVMRIEILLV